MTDRRQATGASAGAALKVSSADSASSFSKHRFTLTSQTITLGRLYELDLLVTRIFRLMCLLRSRGLVMIQVDRRREAQKKINTHSEGWMTSIPRSPPAQAASAVSSSLAEGGT